MADDTSGSGELTQKTENDALQKALAAEHAAVWGYGVVGSALGVEKRAPAATSEAAARGGRGRGGARAPARHVRGGPPRRPRPGRRAARGPRGRAGGRQRRVHAALPGA